MSNEAEKNDITAEDWAAALAEQEAASQGASADGWAAAMAEQQAAQSAVEKPAAAKVFQDLAAEAAPQAPANLDLILDIPVYLTVELGRTKITIRNLLQLAQGSVVELEGMAGEPLDVLVNGTLIAQGEVVVVNDRFGIRLTDIISPAERLRRLHK
ncbi:MAG: flagellar motor switch protein FliN [Thiobacillaceae bacterium]|nr:flagellar motor switch protein FliN [Thiobacillaceae bacterium]